MFFLFSFFFIISLKLVFRLFHPAPSNRPPIKILAARLEDMVQVEEEGNGWRCEWRRIKYMGILFDFNRSSGRLREEIYISCVYDVHIWLRRGDHMLSSLQNLSVQIHIFWREIFDIRGLVQQIQVKKGFRFAPMIGNITLFKWSILIFDWYYWSDKFERTIMPVGAAKSWQQSCS